MGNGRSGAGRGEKTPPRPFFGVSDNSEGGCWFCFPALNENRPPVRSNWTPVDRTNDRTEPMEKVGKQGVQESTFVDCE
jgi:hypothetical protein